MKCKNSKCEKEFDLEEAETFYSDLSEDAVLFNFTCPRCDTQNEVWYNWGARI